MKKRFVTTLSDEIRKELKIQAATKGVPVNELIEQYVKENKKKEGK